MYRRVHTHMYIPLVLDMRCYPSFPIAQFVSKMVEAIIDRDDLLDLGVPCHSATKTHAIGFNTVVRKAKQAAGLCMMIHCLCITLL
jgi:hypothetical protein